MQKTCVQCSSAFEVTDNDLAFYEKVSPVFDGKKYLIPPPTHCPECRQQRRMITRNELTLYKRKCSLTGKDIVSVYNPSESFPVYAQNEWFGDGWDELSHGQEYDLERPFFEQWHKLFMLTPKIALYSGKSENCEYSNHAEGCKNCYLCMSIMWSENCCYSSRVMNSNWVFDCYDVFYCENCYECITVQNSQNIAFCNNISDSHDLLLCIDCASCQNCIGCKNLRQKEYHIFNKKVSKEEFENKKAQIVHDKKSLEQFWQEFKAFSANQITRSLHNTNSDNCTGDYLHNCKNCQECYLLKEAEDCKYCNIASAINDACDDEFDDKSELCYETISLEQTNKMGFSCVAIYTNNCFYSHLIVSCKDCFGCCSLKHKQYCILNKQYSKEEYEALVPQIIEKMKADGEWGEFFPVNLSPFAYNETVAQEYFPMTKEEVEAKGWKWRDEKDEVPEVEKIIQAEQLPDSIDNIPDDILNWAIKCEVTGRPFRIVKQELEFYRKMNLPIPHLHPDERHKRRMALRNPRKLWKRNCDKCGKEMETTYAPGREEKVYCEECYLEEVY
jgi:hypothetical protein